MTETFRPVAGWGPGGHRAALSITFDNFGEAAEMGSNRWQGGPIGHHHTAAFLPRLIALLGEVKTTYFMEGSNAEVYPALIQAWRDAGHEVGLHGWQHEFWLQCPQDRRDEVLDASIRAMTAIGIQPKGFRPPGGAMPQGAWAQLAAHKLSFCSAAGPQGVGRIDGVVSLPFAWRAVDAFMLEPLLGFLRVQQGEREEAYGIADWSDNLDALLEALMASGDHRTLIFHPEFLALAEEKIGALHRLIDQARRQDIWIAPAGEVADFVRAQSRLPVLQTA